MIVRSRIANRSMNSPLGNLGLGRSRESLQQQCVLLIIAVFSICWLIISVWFVFIKGMYVPLQSFEVSPSGIRQATADQTMTEFPTALLPHNAAILVISYNRLDMLKQTIEALVDLPSRNEFQVYISQDGPFQAVRALAEQNKQWIRYMQHVRKAEIDTGQGGTAWLAQHYKWALDQIFIERKHSHVIILEDDLILSRDALILFKETMIPLELDPTIWCVSSWNDHGSERYAHDEKRLFRTDFFPGLGWMMKRDLWMELRSSWPLDHWDHWMRLDAVAKGRSCIVPEVSRNRNIGSVGATVVSDFFSRFIGSNKFQTGFVKSFGNLGYLLENEYYVTLKELVQSGVDVDEKFLVPSSLGTNNTEPVVWRFFYLLEQYAQFPLDQFGLMTTPRTQYKGATVLNLGSNYFVVLIDRRISPFCPVQNQVKSDPSFAGISGKQDRSCDQTCGNANMTCDRSHFQYINTCTALMKAFPCENGCMGGVAGEDVPNYVSNPLKKEAFGKCLTTDLWPTCSANHWSASRLCPCINSK